MGLHYLFLAGLAWILCYVLFKQRWLHRKIVMRFPESTDVRREIRYSCFSLLILGLMAGGTTWAARQGWTQVYWRVPDHGWIWFWASIVVTIFLHDEYFYWTHRLMHHPRLFPIFHRVHHLSHNPSPWAASAFHPAEALVQAGILPLTALVVPIHPLAFAIFMMWQLTDNILGHTGYEIYPRWLMKTPLKFFLNTPTHHAMHHEKMRGNYGIYFRYYPRDVTNTVLRYLQPATAYTVQVRTYDFGNNPSPLSDPVSFTTPPANPNDTTPPTAPANVFAYGFGDGSTETQLSWTQSTDDFDAQANIRYDVM